MISVEGNLLTVCSTAAVLSAIPHCNSAALLLSNTVTGEQILSNFATIELEHITCDKAGVSYSCRKMRDGKFWMTENLRFVPQGVTPSDDLTNVTAGVYYPLVVNGGKTALEFSQDADVIAAQGYLYQNETALGVEVGSVLSVEGAQALEGVQGLCPDGWRVPTYDDINALVGYMNASTNPSAPYADPTTHKGSLSLLNADGFSAAPMGALTIANITTAKAGTLGFMKNSPDAIASGYFCGSSYAGVSYNTAGDATSGVKNIQFWGFMTMTSNNTFNGSKNNFRNAAPLRCVRD